MSRFRSLPSQAHADLLAIVQEHEPVLISGSSVGVRRSVGVEVGGAHQHPFRFLSFVAEHIAATCVGNGWLERLDVAGERFYTLSDDGLMALSRWRATNSTVGASEVAA